MAAPASPITYSDSSSDISDIDIDILNPNFEPWSPSSDDGADDDDDEINIFVKIHDIVTFKVKKSDKIKKAKELCSYQGISENLLDVYYDGGILNEYLTFEQYGIEHNSTLTLVMDVDTKAGLARQVYIKVPSHPQHDTEIIASAMDTIYLVKKLFVNKARLDADDFDLMWDGNYLETHETLEDLEVEKRSVMYLVGRPKEVVPIGVLTPTCGTILFEVKRLQTVGDVKAMVGSMTNSNVRRAKLLHHERPLDEYRVFASYCIEDGALLQLMYYFPVFVRWGTQTIAIEVLPIDDLSALNVKVFEILRWPLCHHPISFRGKKLENGCPIVAYGVRRNSILKMDDTCGYN